MIEIDKKRIDKKYPDLFLFIIAFVIDHRIAGSQIRTDRLFKVFTDDNTYPLKQNAILANIADFADNPIPLVNIKTKIKHNRR